MTGTRLIGDALVVALKAMVLLYAVFDADDRALIAAIGTWANSAKHKELQNITTDMLSS